MANGSSNNQQQQQSPKAQTIQWKNAPIAAQAGAEVLMGSPVSGSGPMSGYTPLYDAQTGGFAGWQDSKGQNFQGYNGMYANYNTRTGEMYAPSTYQPPQQAQQPQQQGPSLQDMWNAYMKQGAQQAPAQQPAQAATITPITPYQGQQLGTARPYATISQTQTPSPFAPPPPPAPGGGQQQQWQPTQQQQWQPTQQQQWPQIQRFQQGGLVQNQNPQQQGYVTGDYNQGLSNSENYLNYLGSLGGSVVINPRPNQGQMGQGSLVGPTGVYTGPQQATVYGSDRGTPTPSIVPGSMGQYTFPNGGQLTPSQMAQFMNGTPEEQALVASDLGTTPQAIIQAAQTYQGTTQGGVPFSVPNAPVQRVSPMAGGGAPAVTPGLGFAQTMPVPSGGGQPNITATMPANAAGYRPLGPSGMPQGGQSWATVPAAGQMAIPPSSVMPPPMMPGGGMFGMGMGMMRGQPGMPPPAPAGVANYTAGGVGVQPQFIAAHNDALTKAGGAFYAHMTGEDPSTATPEQVQNVYNQLMTHATAMINAAAPGGSAAGGAATALGTSASAAPAKKMSTGGLVRGKGKGDTVPALLTPGEYVLNRQQTARLFGGQTPIRMQSGGPVPDDNEPPEVRRQPLTVPTATNQQPNPQTQPGPSPSSSSAPAGSSGNQIDWNAIAQARQDRQGWNAMGTNAYQAPAGSGAMTVGDIGPNTNIPGAGQTQSLGKLGPSGANIGGAVSTLASGLASAAKAYADSIKSWQPIAQAFGGPSAAPSEPVTQFRQERVA